MTQDTSVGPISFQREGTDWGMPEIDAYLSVLHVIQSQESKLGTFSHP